MWVWECRLVGRYEEEDVVVLGCQRNNAKSMVAQRCYEERTRNHGQGGRKEKRG